MDIRRIPFFAEISKPSIEVIKVVYANDLEEIKAIDSQGNIIPFGGGGAGDNGSYSSYVMQLSQTGTNDPVQTLIHNGLYASDLIATYTSVGTYKLALAIEDGFPDPTKIALFVQSTYGSTYSKTYIYWANVSNLTIETVNAAGALANDELYDTTIEIRIYS